MKIQNQKIGLLRILRKNFWDKELLKLYIYLPSICPCCHIGKFNIRENNKNKILNPYIIHCNNKKCKKKIILENIFFSLNPTIIASVICFIIYILS